MALTTNLVSYWKLDESSGNAADSSGNGNTLTNNGSTAYATGKINNGIDLESSGANQYLSIADASQTGLDITGNISISAWVNNESLPTSGNYMCILNKADESAQFSYVLNIYNDAGTYRVWMFVFQTASASVYSHIYWTDTLSTASWFHIAVSVTIANSIATKAECWINGTSKGNGTGADVGGGATSIANSTAPFEIGKGGGSSGRFFDGVIDEVGIWSRVLSSTEVTELYNGGAGLQYPFTSSANTTNFFAMM